MDKMVKYNLNMPKRQIDGLQSLQNQLGLSVSECVRRIVDYSTADHKLNEVFPFVSGRITFGETQ